MSMHGSAITYVIAIHCRRAAGARGQPSTAQQPSMTSPVRSNSADLTTTRSKPAACARRRPSVSLWFVKPSSGTVGYVSATSSGSMRATSQITRSGGSTPSALDHVVAGKQRFELPAEEEIDPDEQDRRHGARR